MTMNTIGGYPATYIKTLAFLDEIKHKYLKPDMTGGEMEDLARAIERHAASLGLIATMPNYNVDNPPKEPIPKPSVIGE